MFKEASTNPEWQGAMQEEMDSIHISPHGLLCFFPLTKRELPLVRYTRSNLVSTVGLIATKLASLPVATRNLGWLYQYFHPGGMLGNHHNPNLSRCTLEQVDASTWRNNKSLPRWRPWQRRYHATTSRFCHSGEGQLVCKLCKSLYGLCQTPWTWYARLHTVLLAWISIQSHSDPNLYFAHIGIT